MAGGNTIVDVTYDDPRTGERVRERRIQEIPGKQIGHVGQREKDLALAPRRPEDPPLSDRRDDSRYYYSRTIIRDKNGQLDVRDGSARRRARSHHRSTAARSASSSSDSSTDRRRRHRKGHRHTRSAHVGAERQDKDDDGILWYSCQSRRDCNFLERNFDSSYDGLVAAAAGAAIGAMTARRFAHKEGEVDKKKTWKTVGGAVAGAAAFNAAENRYRVFTEEKETKREEREYVHG